MQASIDADKADGETLREDGFDVCFCGNVGVAIYEYTPQLQIQQ
jgi:UDP-N-acetylmuramoylalanine-D-glutamate ligase